MLQGRYCKPDSNDETGDHPQKTQRATVATKEKVGIFETKNEIKHSHYQIYPKYHQLPSFMLMIILLPQSQQHTALATSNMMPVVLPFSVQP